MTVQDIIDNIDIVEYISQFIDLEEQGDEYIAICPLHDENTASFSITPETQLYYCFGCHKGGNVLSFIQEYNKCGFKEAIEILKKYANIDEEFVDNRLETTKIIKQFKPKKKKKDELIVHKTLDKNIMQRYEFNKEKLQLWVDEGISLDILNNYQVKYDSFSNRIVFPIRDIDGNIIAVSGRTLDPDYKTKLINGKKIRKYTYFQKIGNLDIIFGYFEHFSYYKKFNEIILFEGAKSVMLCDTWNIKNTGALLTSRLDPLQLKILIKLGIRTIFALDEDKEVNILKDENIKKLARFIPVEYIKDKAGLLKQKMSPVDKGKDTFIQLYNERRRLN